MGESIATSRYFDLAECSTPSRPIFALGAPCKCTHLTRSCLITLVVARRPARCACRLPFPKPFPDAPGALRFSRAAYTCRALRTRTMAGGTRGSYQSKTRYRLGGWVRGGGRWAGRDPLHRRAQPPRDRSGHCARRASASPTAGIPPGGSTTQSMIMESQTMTCYRVLAVS
jgi:hypothetical protein